MRAAPPESPPTGPRSAMPTRDYIQRRREEVEQGKEADEPGPIKRDVNAVLRAWHWIANHLMWVGTSLPPTPDKSFGLIAVNLSPFGFQILYQSVMNVAGDTKEALLKCVLLRDAAGGWKRPEPNTAGQFCDRSLAKCAGSIKLCGVSRLSRPVAPQNARVNSLKSHSNHSPAHLRPAARTTAPSRSWSDRREARWPTSLCVSLGWAW